MAVKSKERLEIERFLSLLEQRVQELGRSTTDLARTMNGGTGHLRFADYVHSRDLSSECWAFSIVIERRIEEYHGHDAEMLQGRFELLTVTIWSALLDCSLQFLNALAREEHLPLGSREVFVREIKTLYDAHRLLGDPRYTHTIDEPMRSRQRQAERILTEIIDRAPALLNLDL